MEPIDTIPTEPVKNPRVANPRELKPREERNPCTLSTIEKQKNLENCLLVISTDTWNKEVQDVINEIKFMKHEHIIFPISAEFFKNEFPATSSDDCWPLSVAEAEEKNCFNRHWPDTFGNFR